MPEGISGAQHAGPLLFDLFRALEPRGSALPEGHRSPRSRLGVASTEVCADSHHLPGPFCPRLTKVDTLADRTKLPTCELHRRVFVDAESSDLLLGECLRQRPSRSTVLSLYPAELTGWWRARGRLDFDEIPPLSPHCRDVPNADPPRIVSPDAATPYLVRPDAPLELFARKGKISGVGLTLRQLVFADENTEFAASQFFPSTGPLEQAVEKSPNSIGITGISSARKRDVKNGCVSAIDNPDRHS